MSTESRTGSLTRGSRQRDRPRKSTAKKKPKIEIEEEGWFEIKDIVEEKVEKGKLRYKVDWSSDKLTGREYSPSWVSAFPLGLHKHVLAGTLVDFFTDSSRRRQRGRRWALEAQEASSSPDRAINSTLEP